MMVGPGSTQHSPSGAVPCPVLRKEALGPRPQRQGRAEVFCRETGNLRRRFVHGVNLDHKLFNTGTRSQVRKVRKHTGFKKEKVSLVKVEGRAGRQSSRLTYGMLA